MASIVFTDSETDVFGPTFTPPKDPHTRELVKDPVVLCSRAEELAVVMHSFICKTIFQRGGADWVDADGRIDRRGFLAKFYSFAPTLPQLREKWPLYTERVQRAAESIFLTDSNHINIDGLRIFNRSTLCDENVLKAVRKQNDVVIFEHLPLQFKLAGIPVQQDPNVSFKGAAWDDLSPIMTESQDRELSVPNNPFYEFFRILLTTYINLFNLIVNLEIGRAHV